VNEISAEVASLGEAPAGEDNKEKKERLERAKEQKGALAEEKKKLREVEKKLAASEAALAKAQRTTMGGDLRLFRKVQGEVSSVYERVLLKNGATNVQQHLHDLYLHFEKSVVAFRKNTEDVATSYSSLRLSEKESLSICNVQTRERLSLQMLEG